MISLLILFIVTNFVIFYLVSKFSYNLNLVDKPNNRKLHLIPTAYTGGLALSLIYIFSIYFFDFNDEKLNMILSISILISVVGLIDDKYNLNFGGKLSLQIIPIIYLITLQNFSLNSLGDYNFIKLDLNSLSIPFTLLSVIFLINATNYFDGMDGTLSLSIISTLSILYFLIFDENIKLYLIIIFIPICIFTFFNFSILSLPKLFLGDSGSLLLGFIISFTLIYLANMELVHPILLAWSIAIIVYEFLAINLIRLKYKRNIFKPGLDHLHHLLFKIYKSIFLVNLIIILINISLFIIGFLFFTYVHPIVSLILFSILFFIFLNFRISLIKKSINKKFKNY